MNKVLFSLSLCLLLLFSSFSIYAQTAAEVDALLETQALSFAQASRFVLEEAGVLDDASPYELARERGWLPKGAAEERPIRLGELCFLMMKAFNIRGSFLWALFPGPRYAFRELDYLALIPGRRDPALLVSGETFLRILGMVSAHAEESGTLHGSVETGGAVSPAERAAIAAAEAAAAEALARHEALADEIRTELVERGVEDTTVRAAETGVTIALSNIQFLADSAVLTEAERIKIMQIGIILSRFPARKIAVEGHTALAGNAEGRRQVSTDRAQAVADFLVYLNVRRKEDITVRGWGAERPLADNASPEGQAINRRVEITLLDEEQP
jgi:outer membrane protein OmpA-like peptidoglycan-associated protein